MMRSVIIAAVLAIASGYRIQPSMKIEMPTMNKAVAAAMAGLFAFGSVQGPAHALSKADILSLSYEQVKGSGLANRCAEVTGEGTIKVGGSKKIVDLCLEPKSWQVETEVGVSKGEPKKEFVNTKLMTRQTYSLEGISGTLSGGTFKEEDGIDYAATTVQLPGGERVPLLFSVKNLVAKTSGGDIKPGFGMSGSFTVPSYRTGLFLDPKGRGTTVGYDFAGALPGLQNGVDGGDSLFNENNKKFDVLAGDIEFAVNRVNEAEGEFGGVFVSNQPSDTDMGGKAPKRVLLKGIFYGRVAE